MSALNLQQQKALDSVGPGYKIMPCRFCHRCYIVPEGQQELNHVQQKIMGSTSTFHPGAYRAGPRSPEMIV